MTSEQTNQSPMLRVRSVPVFVSDQDRALAFYRDILGFEVLVDINMGDNFRWIMVTPGKGETELILYKATQSMNGAQVEELQRRVGTWTGIILQTEDIHWTCRELKRRDVVFEAEPKLQPWRVYEARFSDPDGNRFHLVQRLPTTFDPQ